MIKPYKLKEHLCRFCTFYPADDEKVPKELFSFKNEKPDLSDFPFPLPSKKSEYTCCASVGDIQWLGASNGLTRYDKNAEREEDRIMFFSAPRDLHDNDVKVIMPQGENVWVLTATGVVFIEMKLLSAQEKAELLLAETLEYVDRRGMVSQKGLSSARVLKSRHSHGHSDNDGCFTSGFAIGEVFRYAVFKREKGADSLEALEAKKVATRAVEACLLLMHIHCRGDGSLSKMTFEIVKSGLFSQLVLIHN